MQNFDPNSENPLGKTYWEYYKRNYLVVLFVTAIMAMLATGYSIYDGEITPIYWGIIAFMAAINIICVSLSYYQYKNRI